MAKAIGTLGTIDTLSVGGRIFTDLTTLIVTGGFGASTHFATLRKPGASAGYAVTGGKTLTIHAVKFWTQAAANAALAISSISQVDTDIGMDSASNGTNPVYVYGSISAAPFGEFQSYARDRSMFEYNPMFPVAAGKYHSFQAGGSNMYFQCFSYEA